MRVLFFGAGVLGSLYAARMHEAGLDVSILARGRRLSEIRDTGIVLENAATGRRTVSRVKAVDGFGPDDDYDLVVVPVRKDQLSTVLPVLSPNRRVRSFLFMVCNATGPEAMVEAVGRGRVLLGYAAAGGTRQGGVVRFLNVPGILQKVMVGELDGRATPRVGDIARAFRRSGFPVEVGRDMDSWLKTHVAWVSPAAQAIYLAQGDSYALARRPEIVLLMLRAIREAYGALRSLGVRITGPAWVRSLGWAPEAVLLVVFRRLLASRMGEVSIAGHANAARDEMTLVSEDLKALVRSAGRATPALDRLYGW